MQKGLKDLQVLKVRCAWALAALVLLLAVPLPDGRADNSWFGWWCSARRPSASFTSRIGLWWRGGYRYVGVFEEGLWRGGTGVLTLSRARMKLGTGRL